MRKKDINQTLRETCEETEKNRSGGKADHSNKRSVHKAQGRVFVNTQLGCHRITNLHVRYDGLCLRNTDASIFVCR